VVGRAFQFRDASTRIDDDVAAPFEESRVVDGGGPIRGEPATCGVATITIAKGGGTVLPPITEKIEPGQSLYFIVGPGPNDNIGCDTTQLQITIDQITPNGEPEVVAAP
jgi:hypothetical protein